MKSLLRHRPSLGLALLLVVTILTSSCATMMVRDPDADIKPTKVFPATVLNAEMLGTQMSNLPEDPVVGALFLTAMLAIVPVSIASDVLFLPVDLAQLATGDRTTEMPE